MDKQVMARISDYFYAWKLKVLLKPPDTSCLDQSIGTVDCSLDYNIWRQTLESKDNEVAKTGLVNTVTVRKVGTLGQPEERKQPT